MLATPSPTLTLTYSCTAAQESDVMLSAEFCSVATPLHISGVQNIVRHCGNTFSGECTLNLNQESLYPLGKFYSSHFHCISHASK